MAKKPKQSTIGPTEPVAGGYNEPSFGVPPNPAETLRTGQLGTRYFANATERRPFSIPTKSALHRSEGPSNDEFNQPGHEEGVGSDANRYSQGPNPPTTSEGQPIRGT